MEIYDQIDMDQFVPILNMTNTSTVNETLSGYESVNGTNDGNNSFASNNSFANITEDPLCLLNDYCDPMDDYFDRLNDYIFPTPSEWPLIATYIITFLVGLIGNSLVCFAIWRNRNMRTITNIFIVNLSVADLAVIVICLPSTLLVDVTETWFLGTAFCKIHIYVTTVTVSVSVLTISAISVERWYAICRPLTFHSTVRRARVIIVIIWLISYCVATPELVFATVTPLRNDTIILSACYPSLMDERHLVIFQIVLMVLLYFVPLTLMALTHTHIAVVLSTKSIPGVAERGRTVLRHQNHPRAPDNEEQLETRKKAAKMLIAVVIMFGLCFFPIHLFNILRYTNQQDKMPYVSVFALIAHWATFFNSCINPLIYNFMSDKFRKEFKVAIALCVRCGRKVNSWEHARRYKMTFNSGRSYSTRYSSHYNGSTVNNATCVEHVPLTHVHNAHKNTVT